PVNRRAMATNNVLFSLAAAKTPAVGDEDASAPSLVRPLRESQETRRFRGFEIRDGQSASSLKQQIPEALRLDRRGCRQRPGLKADAWHRALNADGPGRLWAGGRAGELAERDGGFDRPGSFIAGGGDEPLRVPGGVAP